MLYFTVWTIYTFLGSFPMMRLVHSPKIGFRFLNNIFVLMKSISLQSSFHIVGQVVICWSQIKRVEGWRTTSNHNFINFATTNPKKGWKGTFLWACSESFSYDLFFKWSNNNLSYVTCNSFKFFFKQSTEIIPQRSGKIVSSTFSNEIATFFGFFPLASNCSKLLLISGVDIELFFFRWHFCLYR